jgi:AcrR family transcriptional regulator
MFTKGRSLNMRDFDKTTRQRILSTAREELNIRSIKFTMDHLAARLGLSKKSVYKHFSSKQALIGEVIDYTLQEIVCQEELIYQNSALALPDQLRQLLLLYVQMLRPFHKTVLTDLKRYYPDEWQKLENFRQRKWQMIAGLLQEEIDHGRIRPVSYAIMQLIISKTVQNLLSIQPLAEDAIPLDTAIKELADILLTGNINDPNCQNDWLIQFS